MVYVQLIIYPGESDVQIQGFWDKNGSPNLGQTTGPYNNQQKKRTHRIEDFVLLTDHKVELKDSE